MPSKQPTQNLVLKNTNRQALEDRCFPLKQQARSHEPTNRNCKAIWESTGIEHYGFILKTGAITPRYKRYKTPSYST